MLTDRFKPTEQPINVLVILGHPRTDSFCAALAEAFCRGSRAAGVQLRRLDLAGLDFDSHLHMPSPNDQPLEDDLCRARELFLWADHLVIVYPTWWGGAPALLKGFLDRLMAPGFAFRTCEGGIGYEGLLQGRSAQLITTMDTPPLVHRLLYRQPGKNALARATLGFCGIRPVRSLVFGSVKNASANQREAWLGRAEQQGRKLEQGRITPMERLQHKTGAWLRSLRLQFYPMSWVAYTIGALAASPGSSVLGTSVFWVGYLCLFLLEVATVLVNELVDLPSDQRNSYYNAFTGGSRVLVDGSLSQREVKTGIGVALLGLLASIIWLLALSTAAPVAMIVVLGALTVLAIGYTAPPLKLSYRGLGELDVAVTHSIGVLLCGYVFLGGAWSDPTPWLLSVPMLLGILPSITLSGIPDLEADALASKRTLAVRFGFRNALGIAIFFVLLSCAAALAWQAWGLAGGAYSGIGWLVVPHAAMLTWLLYQHFRTDRAPGRIDGLMVASLGYTVWFGLVPLLRLL
ncbi:Putative NADPH-quinone reductase (modulator of drug activity B) [Marinobacter daqiaonensis]|uniref:Putative NADPH-quinone reductase (Modulator of drug activity B) n=1 Tax=Marinobacter daqiaonensis TaxID=650891 RepID=A0A1I6IAK0_9GAMM|nr:NAD(P)H-dependent oxidoreductase [Marinobacter daqiaonensis]SFR63713.1 Putative NADPH-quinone reductase (modulator of drug activity B) [Marinobacter daqiaonensis]